VSGKLEFDVFQKADELAKLAVEVKAPSTQLEGLYHMVKRLIREGGKPEYLISFIRYQCGRGFLDWELGKRLEEVFEQTGRDLKVFSEVIRHTIMLYTYYDAKRFIDRTPEIRREVERHMHGTRVGELISVRTSMERGGGRGRVVVEVKDLRVHPRELEERLEGVLRRIPGVRDFKPNVQVERR
jgi:hypothetical protein